MITWLHALWGDELVAGWPKILRDIQQCPWRNANYFEGGNRLVFAYGSQNFRWLDLFGLNPILVHDDPIVDWCDVKDRTHSRPNHPVNGSVNYGVHMWHHKQHAITLAFERGVTELIWLDWDTRINANAAKECLSRLADGPDFQGRMRFYVRRKPGIELKRFYHGGCYYMRSPEVVLEANRLRLDMPYLADEVLMTIAINNLHFSGRSADPEEHEAAGFNNGRLHGVKHNAVTYKPDDKQQSLYYEGRVVGRKPFEKHPMQ
jgi:hypothetical protein